MAEMCRNSSMARLVILVMFSRLVLSYENGYDLMDRRRFITHSSNTRGNGYDNLGTSFPRNRNRFQTRRFDGFQDRREFEPLRRWQDPEPLENRRLFLDPQSDPFDDRRRIDSFRVIDQFDRRDLDLDLSRRPGSLDDRRTLDAFREDIGRNPSIANRRAFLEDSAIRRPVNDFSRRALIGDIPRRRAFDDAPRDIVDDIPRRRVFDDAPRDIIDDIPRTVIDDDLPGTPLIDQPRRLISDDLGQEGRIQPAFYRKDYFRRPTPVHTVRHYRPQSQSGYENQDQGNSYEKAGGDKEKSTQTTLGSYLSSKQGEKEDKSESGSQDSKEGAKLDVTNKQHIGEKTLIDKNGGNKSSAQSKKVAKKGHTTKGFATHHHKDETGNSTTFYDEVSDTDGKTDYQDLEDEFGTRRTLETLNGKEDGRFFTEHGTREGNFGSGTHRDKSKVAKDIVAKDDRFNQEESFGNGRDHFNRGYKSAADYLGGGQWREAIH